MNQRNSTSMGAPMLSASEQQASLRANMPKPAKGKQTIKHVLMPPYRTDWPVLDKDIELKTSEMLREHLQKFALPREKAGKKQKDLQNGDVKQTKQLLRSQVVFGVNSVTKALEKDLLQLVITCKSADPPILTKHLKSLSENRKCVAICIDDLNKILTDLINIGSIAIGFNKLSQDSSTNVEDFSELINFVKSTAPKPWTDHEEQHIEKDVTTVSQDLPEIQREVTTVSQDLPEIQREVTTVSQDLPEIQKEVNMVSQDLPEIQKEVSMVSQDLTEIQKEVTTVSQDLPEIQREVTTVSQDLPEIQREVTTVYVNTEKVPDNTEVNPPSSADYSRFYVFKKDFEKGVSFIPFSIDSDSDETPNKSHFNNVWDNKKKRKVSKEEEYVKVNVKKMKTNENKKHKKKLKKKH